MTIPFQDDTCGLSYKSVLDPDELARMSSDPSISPEEPHLVLDLDHTLISSFEFGESPAQRRGISTVCPILTEEYKDEYGLPELYHATISNVVVLIKLRPHVRKFIKEASRQGLFLHVYTKGRRSYMNEVVRLIDPDGCIKGKLISRDDEPSHLRDNQKDPSLIHSTKRPFVVLDDSPIVWSACASYAQIIAAQRYSFSDKFVTFLKSVESTLIKTYPLDSDTYLATVLATHIQTSLSLIAPMVSRTRTGSTVDDDVKTNDDDSYSPISDWEKPRVVFVNTSHFKGHFLAPPQQ